MVRSFRGAYLPLAWVFLAGVIVQFLLAGTAVFASPGFNLHRDFGLVLLAGTVLLIVVALFARLRRAAGIGVLLFILFGIQVFLVRLRRPYAPLDLEPAFITSMMQTVMQPIHDLVGSSAAWIASLHVLNGLAILGASVLNLQLARV